MVRCDDGADGFASLPPDDETENPGETLVGQLRVMLVNLREQLTDNKEPLTALASVAAVVAALASLADWLSSGGGNQNGGN